MCLIRGPVKAKQQFKLDKNSIFVLKNHYFQEKKIHFAKTSFSTRIVIFILLKLDFQPLMLVSV